MHSVITTYESGSPHQGWIPKGSVVWPADVRDVEVDELGAVVLAFPEGDREADLPYRCGGTVGHS